MPSNQGLVVEVEAPSVQLDEAETARSGETSSIEDLQLLVSEDLLIEDVSIDGMCGVY
jgi:mycofactocin precursor